MSKNIEAYKIWAPYEVHWTHWTKPVLFINAEDNYNQELTIELKSIPQEITGMNNKNTAIIVDLPGKLSILSGLSLASSGYRPIPLYNCIFEKNTGGLESIVDNEEVVERLIPGAKYLQSIKIEIDAPPAFLLDFNRGRHCAASNTMYDNRWDIYFSDMPEAGYLKKNSIDRLVVWTDTDINDDLIPIISSYRNEGIELFIYCGERLCKFGEKVVEAAGEQTQQGLLSKIVGKIADVFDSIQLHFDFDMGYIGYRGYGGGGLGGYMGKGYSGYSSSGWTRGGYSRGGGYGG